MCLHVVLSELDVCEQVSMSKCLSLFVHVTESVSLGIAVKPNNSLKLLCTHTQGPHYLCIKHFSIGCSSLTTGIIKLSRIVKKHAGVSNL